MIRTNLSTRPFYNQRAVSLWIGSLALVVAAATRVQSGERHRLQPQRYRARHAGLP